MDSHYCDIFSDCYRCPAPFCPYEKYDDDGNRGAVDGAATENEQDEEEDDDG